MGFEVVTQDSVLEAASGILKTATKRVWITSPWIRARAANLLLRNILPHVRERDIDVRIVYRVKEPTDLEITDLEALKTFEDAGCKVRYSTRLHAKLLLVDENSAIVSSSNLTSTAGYGHLDPTWRNEELGILVRDDADVLSELEGQFSLIWDAATSVDENTLGIAMDLPSVGSYNFVAIRDVRLGEYVVAGDTEGDLIIGKVSQIHAFNHSFPQMNEAMWITSYGSTGEGQRRTEVPDLQSLFSHPSKEHGFLVTKTFFEPESVFHIAQVEVLKHRVAGRLSMPGTPIAPGSDVSRASPQLLAQLLGEGDLYLGTVYGHDEVEVKLRTEEIATKHLAVLGMTGSGKSNCVKGLIRNLLIHANHKDLRIFVVDTHGEYEAVGNGFGVEPIVLDVDLRDCVLDEDVIKSLARLTRQDSALVAKLNAIFDDLPQGASLEDYLTAIETQAHSDVKHGSAMQKLVDNARSRTDLCLREEEGAMVISRGGGAEKCAAAGLYILNLRETVGFKISAAKAAALMRQVFAQRQSDSTSLPAIIILEEAQNFCPEQQTGWLADARLSFDAAFQIATEGRKFGVGLVVATQRPARVNKDILSQCNSQLIFRVANIDDLAAVQGSFEAASRGLVDSLPGFETGVCVAGGTMLEMVIQARVPLFLS